jgi:hypothetical protein
MIQGWYYLHTNKELIYKNDPDAIADIRDSDLCRAAWAWDGGRATAWKILVEALSLGAKKERIEELAKKWGCDDADAIHYANHLQIVLGKDGDQDTATRFDFVNLQEDRCGFGDTRLEAMADLCSQLGYTGGKMWNAGFEDLVCDHASKKMEAL